MIADNHLYLFTFFTLLRIFFNNAVHSKTEFVIFGDAQNINKVSKSTVSVGEVKVLQSRTVRDIRAMLDKALTMMPNVNSVTKSLLQN